MNAGAARQEPTSAKACVRACLRSIIMRSVSGFGYLYDVRRALDACSLKIEEPRRGGDAPRCGLQSDGQLSTLYFLNQAIICFQASSAASLR